MKRVFAIGLLSIIGSFSLAQLPKDTLTYYTLDKALSASPDTIYAIDLHRERLRSVPPSIKKFHHLKGLTLSKNKLEELPAFIKSFHDLQFLYVEKNRFSHFPAAIFYLSRLKHLNISRNKIGSIPAGIKALQKLEYLDIWDNRLTRIDDGLTKLQNLKFIDFRGTTFAPSFVEKWTTAFPNAQVEFDAPCNCLE